jgi:hypothetical protein
MLARKSILEKMYLLQSIACDGSLQLSLGRVQLSPPLAQVTPQKFMFHFPVQTPHGTQRAKL